MSATSAAPASRAGQDGPGSPARSGAPRPRSLRTRLVVGVLGLVLVTAALMSAFSTLTLRYTLMGHLDEKLAAASERAAARRHVLDQDEQARTGEEVDEATPSCDADLLGHPTAPPGDGSVQGGVPPGLDAPGQPTGTLTVIIPGATSGEPAGDDGGDGGQYGEAPVVASYIDAKGRYVALTRSERVKELLSVSVDGRPTTVHVASLGDYRVMATRDELSGDVVITGLSMEEDNRLVRTQLLIEAGIAAAGALVVALVGRSMVRSSLAPLERVAETAQHVASLPLERGEVTIEERVPAEDLASSTEVNQVGAALNTLLGHVENALAARQRSETQVRQFVADASHELRTPLASIRGYTELIRREGADAALPEDAVHALQRVHSESLRMTALVEDLLLLASLDAGRELTLTEVDLVGLLVDAVADARAAGPDHDWQLRLEALEPARDGEESEESAEAADAAAEGGAVLRTGEAGPQGGGQEDAGPEELLPEPPLVMGDEPRLRQVVVNLLANARVHTPAGTHVVTTLLRRDGHLVVRISDDGPGVDPSLRERLFERFARGDASRERRTGSTGLGMSIALAIVQSHQGTLRVESRTAQEDPEDHGTTCTIELPATGSAD